MKFPIEKVLSTGNKNILVTERGTSFGYHDLVVDMRGLVEMKKFGFPVIMDVTHSVQKPSARNGKVVAHRNIFFHLQEPPRQLA